jgi:hypothetical protein
LQIKQFLEAKGLDAGAIRPTGMGAVKFQVAAIDSLIRFARGVLETRCLFKKRKELQIMLAYFDGKVTGDQVIEFLNQELETESESENFERPSFPSHTSLVGACTRKATRE